MENSLQVHFNRIWQRYFLNFRRPLVLVSAGVDSIVLLSLLRARQHACGDPPPHVLHINYRLRPNENNAEENLVCKACDHKGALLAPAAPLTVVRAGAIRGNVQSFARQFRYRHAARIANFRHLDAIVTAHHSDDAVETFLLAMLKAASPETLSGIPFCRRMNFNGKRFAVLRPLLAVDQYYRNGKGSARNGKGFAGNGKGSARSEKGSARNGKGFAGNGVDKQRLIDYANDHHLEYCEDSSNAESSYRRNFLRLEILPRLRDRFPAARANLLAVKDRLAIQQKIDKKLLSQFLRVAGSVAIFHPLFFSSFSLREQQHILVAMLGKWFVGVRISAASWHTLAVALAKAFRSESKAKKDSAQEYLPVEEKTAGEKIGEHVDGENCKQTKDSRRYDRHLRCLLEIVRGQRRTRLNYAAGVLAKQTQPIDAEGENFGKSGSVVEKGADRWSSTPFRRLGTVCLQGNARVQIRSKHFCAKFSCHNMASTLQFAWYATTEKSSDLKNIEIAQKRGATVLPRMFYRGREKSLREIVREAKFLPHFRDRPLILTLKLLSPNADENYRERVIGVFHPQLLRLASIAKSWDRRLSSMVWADDLSSTDFILEKDTDGKGKRVVESGNTENREIGAFSKKKKSSQNFASRSQKNLNTISMKITILSKTAGEAKKNFSYCIISPEL